jgi:hypothetical protein
LINFRYGHYAHRAAFSEGLESQALCYVQGRARFDTIRKISILFNGLLRHYCNMRIAIVLADLAINGFDILAETSGIHQRGLLEPRP